MRKIFIVFVFIAFAVFCNAQAQPSKCGNSLDNPCWIGVSQSEIPLAPPKMLPEVLTDISWAALATADVDLSHRCIVAHLCYEGNPILSDNLTRASLLVGLESFGGMWAFHYTRKSHRKLAWLIPAVNVGVHAIAIYHYEHGR